MRGRLRHGFSTLDMQAMEIGAIVDLLYDVRCDVVHEGRYWGFHFAEKYPLVNTPGILVNITYRSFRDVVVEGCIRAIDSYQNCARAS